MKKYLAAFLMLAQGVCSYAQLPAPIPSGPAGLLSMRSAPPFRARITEKSGTPGNFHLTLKAGDVTRMFTVIGGSDAESRMFAHLQVGVEYEFPKVFDKVLGVDASIPSTIPTPVAAAQATTASPAAFLSSQPQLALLDLNRCAPFRAQITGKTLASDSVALSLACTDGRNFTLQHGGNPRLDEARRIVGPLEEGRFYEFPMSVIPPYQDKTAPPSAEMQPLTPFIGVWESENMEKPGETLRVHYHWKNNGAGIWREFSVRRPGSDDYRMTGATLITYAGSPGHYLETPTRPGISPPIEKNWDATSRTLTSVHISSPESQRKATTVHTLKSDDRIEWKTTLTSLEGQFIEAHQGRYDRLKP